MPVPWMLWAYTVLPTKCQPGLSSLVPENFLLIKFVGTFRLKLETKWLKLLPMSSLNLKLRSNEIHSIGFDCIMLHPSLSRSGTSYAAHSGSGRQVKKQNDSNSLMLFMESGPQAVRWEGFPRRYRTRNSFEPSLWHVWIQHTLQHTLHLPHEVSVTKLLDILMLHVLLMLVDLTMPLNLSALEKRVP